MVATLACVSLWCLVAMAISTPLGTRASPTDDAQLIAGTVLTYRTAARTGTSLEWALSDAEAGATNATTPTGPTIFVPFYEAPSDPRAVLQLEFSVVTRDTSTLSIRTDPATGLRTSTGVLLDATPSDYDARFVSSSAPRVSSPPTSGFVVALMNRGTWASLTLSVGGSTFLHPTLIRPFVPVTVEIRIFFEFQSVDVLVSGTRKTFVFATTLPTLPQWPCTISVAQSKDGAFTGFLNKWESAANVEIFDLSGVMGTTVATTSASGTSALAMAPRRPIAALIGPPRATIFRMLDPPVRFPKEIGMRPDTTAISDPSVLSGKRNGPPQFIRVTFSFTLSSEPWRSWFSTGLLAAGRYAYPALVCMTKAVTEFGNNDVPFLLRIGLEPNMDATQPSARLHAALGDGINGIASAVLVSWPPVHGMTRYDLEFVAEFDGDSGAPKTAAVRFAASDSSDLGAFVPLLDTGNANPPLPIQDWIKAPNGGNLYIPTVVGAPCVGVQASTLALTDFVVESFAVEYFPDLDAWNAILVSERRPALDAFPGASGGPVNTFAGAAAARPIPALPLLPVSGTYVKILEAKDAGERPQLIATAYTSVVAALPKSSMIVSFRVRGSLFLPRTCTCQSWGTDALDFPNEMPIVSFPLGVLDLFVSCSDRSLVARSWGASLATNSGFSVAPDSWVAFTVTVTAPVRANSRKNSPIVVPGIIELLVSGVGAARALIDASDTMPTMDAWNADEFWVGRGWGTAAQTPLTLGPWQVQDVEVYLGTTAATGGGVVSPCAAQSTQKACSLMAPTCAWVASSKSRGVCIAVGGDDDGGKTAAPTLTTDAPTPPTSSPVRAPTRAAETKSPTVLATNSPTMGLTTLSPSRKPRTASPVRVVTAKPTARPTTRKPTMVVSGAPSRKPTRKPTDFYHQEYERPSSSSKVPTRKPSGMPTYSPNWTGWGTSMPSMHPTQARTNSPTVLPTSSSPTTRLPTTRSPTTRPSSTAAPTTAKPTVLVTSTSPTSPTRPGQPPTLMPTERPTTLATAPTRPTRSPQPPTPVPTDQPSVAPIPLASRSTRAPSTANEPVTLAPGAPRTWRPTRAPLPRLGTSQTALENSETVVLVASLGGGIGLVLVLALVAAAFVVGRRRKLRNDAESSTAKTPKRRRERGPGAAGDVELGATTPSPAMVVVAVAGGEASSSSPDSAEKPAESATGTTPARRRGSTPGTLPPALRKSHGAAQHTLAVTWGADGVDENVGGNAHAAATSTAARRLPPPPRPPPVAHATPAAPPTPTPSDPLTLDVVVTSALPLGGHGGAEPMPTSRLSHDMHRHSNPHPSLRASGAMVSQDKDAPTRPSTKPSKRASVWVPAPRLDEEDFDLL